MRDCKHCDGTGVCKDDYHSSVNAPLDLLMGSGCSQGCGGGSLGGGPCTHCGGSGKEKDDD
jgi:DnaJ-class molecular chaperone